jgi:hypothetical protein
MVYGDFSVPGQRKNKANLCRRRNLPKPSPSLRDEAATRSRPADKEGDLKKQSQFSPYGNNPALGVEKNKPNQSQLPAGAFRIGGKKGREV